MIAAATTPRNPRRTARTINTEDQPTTYLYRGLGVPLVCAAEHKRGPRNPNAFLAAGGGADQGVTHSRRRPPALIANLRGGQTGNTMSRGRARLRRCHDHLRVSLENRSGGRTRALQGKSVPTPSSWEAGSRIGVLARDYLSPHRRLDTQRPAGGADRAIHPRVRIRQSRAGRPPFRRFAAVPRTLPCDWPGSLFAHQSRSCAKSSSP
jgi:hypothetical protein